MQNFIITSVDSTILTNIRSYNAVYVHCSIEEIDKKKNTNTKSISRFFSIMVVLLIKSSGEFRIRMLFKVFVREQIFKSILRGYF